tara:strand:+ start:2728 stop:3990 length:1263 start_codon:yes stop_codon:yes gene_type:complete
LTYKVNKYLESLYSLHRRGIKLGLEHTERLLSFFDNPHKKFSTIHVAGTNGKGSTCAYIETILRQNGYKVGLYTSPHLLKFNERIRVNGRPISNKHIFQFLDNSFDEINKINSTFFEATTVMAFNYFYKKKVDVAVIETGLGGRLDATNVINPKISVITSISKDHTDILGDSLEKIAYEKAGIIKEKTPLIIYRQDSQILEVFRKKAVSLNADMKISKIPKNIEFNSKGTQFIHNNYKYVIPLFGFHQARNASLAIDVINKVDPNIKNEAINRALGRVFWPGRMQKVGNNIFYDVSHNENGLKKTLQTLKKLYPNQNLHGLMCLKKDKNVDSLKKLISENFKTLIVSGNENELLSKSSALEKKLSGLNIQCKSVSSLNTGLVNIKNIVKNSSSVGLIFGSHYVANEVFDSFEISFDNYYI